MDILSLANGSFNYSNPLVQFFILILTITYFVGFALYINYLQFSMSKRQVAMQAARAEDLSLVVFDVRDQEPERQLTTLQELFNTDQSLRVAA